MVPYKRYLAVCGTTDMQRICNGPISQNITPNCNVTDIIIETSGIVGVNVLQDPNENYPLERERNRMV